VTSVVTAKPTVGVRARALAKVEAGESVAGAIAFFCCESDFAAPGNEK
jgi:hypothetical protein